MIEDDFEFLIIWEDEVTETPKSDLATYDIHDIKSFAKQTLKGHEVTAVEFWDGKTILADYKYERFKKKYSERKAEILVSMGNRPDNKS